MARKHQVLEPVRPAKPMAMHAVVTASVLLLIVYVALQVAARTEGFRSLVAEQVGKRIGMPVKIAGSGVNWRFDLTLEHLVTEGTKRPSSPGFRAQRIRLDWNLAGLWRGAPLRAVELDRPRIVLAREEQGDWKPDEFRALSDFLGRWLELELPAPGAAKPVAEADPFDPEAARPAVEDRARAAAARLQRTGMTVAFRDGAVEWWDGGQAPAAAVDRIHLQITPLRAPERALTHVRMRVAEVRKAGGERLRDADLELVDAGDQQVLLRFSADRVAASGAR